MGIISYPISSRKGFVAQIKGITSGMISLIQKTKEGLIKMYKLNQP